MSYQVNLPKTVQKQLNALPQKPKQRILKALVQLQSIRTRGSDRLIRIQKQNQPKSSKPVFIIREY